ncbi:MAG: hypothetical protein ACRCZR_08145 [Cetobacterium sp.]
MEKIYITNSNFNLFLKQFDVLKVEYNFIIKEIENDFDKGVLFSKLEKKSILFKKNMILNYKEFSEKNEKLLINNIQNVRERNIYILNNSSPAYHSNPDCPKLNSDYNNFEISSKLHEDYLKEYKIWLENNSERFHKNRETFDLIHIKRWTEEIEFPVYITRDNSGTKEVNLIDIENFKKEISDIFKIEVEKEDKEEFRKIVQYSYLANKPDDEIQKKIIIKYKSTLLKIHKLKNKIISCLIKSYTNEASLKIRDDFNVSFLEKLGFRPCKSCNQIRDLK